METKITASESTIEKLCQFVKDSYGKNLEYSYKDHEHETCINKSNRTIDDDSALEVVDVIIKHDMISMRIIGIN